MKKEIKFFITDIDGTLTDGKVYMGNDGEIAKAFSIKDGYALSFLLKDARIEPIVITGRTSKIVERRCGELGIKRVFQGITDKYPTLKSIVGNKLRACAYFGDDILDLNCMKPIKSHGGIVGCPADAVSEVKTIADYVCKQRAGEGAGREFIEWLIADNTNEEMVKERVDEALIRMSELVKGNPDCGIYTCDDWLTVTVKDTETQRKELLDLESHRNHVDIQWVLRGEEVIDIANTAALEQASDYDVDKDVVLWADPASMMRVSMAEGSYMVLYPTDAHKPCIALSEKQTIRVAIGKVRIADKQ